ncbi:SMP-30/gluconolactonase/LRE family protein [bacterium]|nr:SMP-30/gluconolactonase/LRE family protein [bacterium]
MRTVLLAVLVIIPVSALMADEQKISVGTPEVVRTGFQFLEGPAWDGKDTLYFTDVPAQCIYRITGKNDLSKFRDESGHSNGLLKWGDYLYACEMDGQVVRYKLGDVKTREVIAGQYQGKRFNACNDLVVDKQGGVYFTDPEYGAPKPWPQKVRSVYHVAPNKEVTRIVEELPNPNGILLSPDEKTLYVIPSGQSEVMAYNVLSPGKLDKGRVFASLKQPEGKKNSGGDGGTVDKDGNIYVTSDLGVQVFSPAGKLMEVISLPEVPANVTFGGPDNKSLYMTARTSLYRVATNRVGHVFGP